MGSSNGSLGSSRHTRPNRRLHQLLDRENRIVGKATAWLARLGWLGLAANKFHTWKRRYGTANDHNGKIPRDWWLQDWERQAIIAFHDKNPLEGYRRLAFMMLDEDIVAVSPSTAYRVLKAAGRLDRKSTSTSSKGKGFKQPKKPHKHWHTDVTYIKDQQTKYSGCKTLQR